MTSSNLKLVFLAASLVCIFSTILLYQNSLEFLFQIGSTPSLKFNRSESADLIFLKNPEIRIDLKMNVDAMDNAFYKFLSERHFACQNNERLGNVLDGGWDICLAEPYRPKPPCLVYSFGINNDFSFDDAISSNFSCTVRSFDPSMAVQDHKRSDKIWFYKIGIGGEDKLNSIRWIIGGKDKINGNGWIMKTLPSIMKSMNESDVIIDYLKMDVENSEWSSLTQMLSKGTLSKVKQLGIEVHLTGSDKESLFYMYDILKRLEDQGFRRWYYAPNFYQLRQTEKGFRSSCYEMVYINIKYL